MTEKSSVLAVVGTCGLGASVIPEWITSSISDGGKIIAPLSSLSRCELIQRDALSPSKVIAARRNGLRAVNTSAGVVSIVAAS